jgi:hypothetical protein
MKCYQVLIQTGLVKVKDGVHRRVGEALTKSKKSLALAIACCFVEAIVVEYLNVEDVCLISTFLKLEKSDVGRGSLIDIYRRVSRY